MAVPEAWSRSVATTEPWPGLNESLLNCTDGGDGSAGAWPPPESLLFTTLTSAVLGVLILATIIGNASPLFDDRTGPGTRREIGESTRYATVIGRGGGDD